MNRWRRLVRVAGEITVYILFVLLPFSKAAVEITFGVLLLTWSWERLDPQTRTQTIWLSARLRPLAVALAAFFAVSTASVLASDFPLLSLNGLVNKWAEYLLLFVIMADLGTRPFMWRAFALLAFSAMCVVVQGLLQETSLFHRMFGLHPAHIYGRMTGPYENPIDLATYLIVMIPVIGGIGWGWRGIKRVSLWVLLAGMLACLIRTRSQGAWLGGLIGVLTMGWLEKRFRPLLAMLIVFTLVASVLAFGKSPRGEPHALHLDIGIEDRLVMWQAAWRMIQDRPVLGHGVNTFMANYLRYRVGGEPQPRYAHNCVLQVAAETGFLGLATFVWVIGALLAFLWRAIRMVDRSRAIHAVLMGLSIGLTAFLAQSLIDTNFYSLRQAALFWTLAGVAMGLASIVFRSHDMVPRTQ